MKPSVNQSHERASDVCYKFRNAFAQSIATECGFLKAISLRGLSVLPVLSFGQLFLLRKVPTSTTAAFEKFRIVTNSSRQSETSQQKKWNQK